MVEAGHGDPGGVGASSIGGWGGCRIGGGSGALFALGDVLMGMGAPGTRSTGWSFEQMFDRLGASGTPSEVVVLVQSKQSRAVHQFPPSDPAARVHTPPQAVPVLALLRGDDGTVLTVVPAAVLAWSGDSVRISWAARRGVQLYSAWVPAEDVVRGEAASRLLDEFAFGGGQQAVLARFLAWREAQPRSA